MKNDNRGWTSQGPIQGFYVDHDFRMGEAWLYRLSDNRIELWTWFKYDRDGEAKVQSGRLRCFSGNKVLQFGDATTDRTEVSYDHYTSQRDHEKVTWGLWYCSVPRIEGVMAADYLKNNPGEYQLHTDPGRRNRQGVPFHCRGRWSDHPSALPGHEDDLCRR